MLKSNERVQSLKMERSQCIDAIGACLVWEWVKTMTLDFTKKIFKYIFTSVI